jgi:hypothetical protein
MCGVPVPKVAACMLDSCHVWVRPVRVPFTLSRPKQALLCCLFTHKVFNDRVPVLFICLFFVIKLHNLLSRQGLH